MRVTSVKFKGYSCFKDDYVGFEEIKLINVVIGRNNTGKSQMLDLAEKLTQKTTDFKGVELQFRACFDEFNLNPHFRPNTGEGDLPGNHWRDHGMHLVGVPFICTLGADSSIQRIEVAPDANRTGLLSLAGRRSRLLAIAGQALPCPLHERWFCRLNADRNIRPEVDAAEASVTPDGAGATNLIRRYILSKSFPHELVQRDLLNALNEIFGQDGHFTDIQVRQHDDDSTPLRGHWEVFLGEEHKGLIALSSSGSGLKTIILVLLNLIVMPHRLKLPRSRLAFGFEELENNLHPALLRRLFRYLENFALKEQTPIFLTTHSSVALDIFGFSENAQIIRVTHDGKCASARAVPNYVERLDLLSDLGAKPSDLLQANGVIWVEGPSDRVYLNRWIKLLSDGRFREGRDYQCAFYSGALLAQVEFKPLEEEISELVNLFRLNPNVVVICDSDRTGSADQLKPRVQRIQEELEKLPSAHIWITGAKEIENYLPGKVLESVYGVENLPDPKEFERFFPSESKGKHGRSYLESKCNRRTVDKVKLALLAEPHITVELMQSRFDWAESVRAIIERIERWNQ